MLFGSSFSAPIGAFVSVSCGRVFVGGLVKVVRMLSISLRGWLCGWLIMMSIPAFAGVLPFVQESSYRLTLTPSDKGLSEVISLNLDGFAAADSSANTDVFNRIKTQKDIIARSLRAEGYYSFSIDHQFDDRGDVKTQQVVYRIQQGQRYKVAALHFQFPQQVAAPAAPADTSLKVGSALRAQDLLNQFRWLQTWVAEHSCLVDPQLDYQVTLNRELASADITYRLKEATPALVGHVEFVGAKNLSPDMLARKVLIKPGDCFRRAKLDDAKLALLQTQLLTRVDYRIQRRAGELSAAGYKVVDVVFTLEEYPRRSMSVGLGYSTDYGPGVTLGWQNRNLFSGGEQLAFKAGVDEVNQYISGSLGLPEFFAVRQSLTLSSEIRSQKTDAFNTSQLEASAVISRKIAAPLTASYGVTLTATEVETLTTSAAVGGAEPVASRQSEIYRLVGVPVTLNFDNRANPLDAKRGWTMGGSVQPMFDLTKTDTRFFQWTVSAAHYQTASRMKFKPTLALRAAAGAITGAGVDDIPADQLFYVGGGGSVRGYPYQTLGALQTTTSASGGTDITPLGGKSYGELAAELRLQLSESWGLVVFTDGGYAYPDELPKFGEDFYWGAGLGLRFITSFAPIRFDVAVPLQQRDQIDDDFQLYISIGQAF